MVGTLQPLDKKFAIFDRFGNPTDYFVRWAQQKQIDITGSIALSDLIAYLDAHQLIAGVGIQFAPGPNGDLNSNPTIHADVQAILDEISATRGIIIYRGNLGWAALLPGTAGYVLQTNGAGADPTWVAPAGGGGGATFIPPVLANFTYSNQPAGATATAITGGIQMFSPSLGSAFNLNVLLQNTPATPWTQWLRSSCSTNPAVAYSNFGIALADASGKLITWGNWTGATTGGNDIEVNYYNSYTSRSSFTGQNGTVITAPLIGINDDGTNLNFLFSYDGVTSFKGYSASRTAWLAAGPTKMGIFTMGYSQPTTANFVHWASNLPGPM